MSSHTMVCPKQVIKCPFNDMGGVVTPKREDLPAHVKEDITLHMDMMAKEAKEAHIHHRRVVPIVIKYTGFGNDKDNNENWYSEGFYTGIGGYKVRLNIYPNGDGKSTDLSVFINLMPGANDGALEFPLRGTFTVTILNHLEDNNHHTMSIPFGDNTSERCSCRQYKLDDYNGRGYNKFISHSSLGFNQDCNTKYLHHDTVYFRVTAKISSKTKPWLAVM